MYSISYFKLSKEIAIARVEAGIPQLDHSATGTLTALTRDEDKGTAESLYEQRPAIEARKWLNGQLGQNTPREQSPASIEGEGRPQPGLTIASSLYCLAKGLSSWLTP
jgi:hypothetical protein